MSVKNKGEINITVNGAHVMSVKSLIAVMGICHIVLDAKV